MKHTQLKKLIREEILDMLGEGKVGYLELWSLKQSDDGNFRGETPIINFYNVSRGEAERLASEFTKGQYDKYPQFYSLERNSIKIYS